MSQSLLRSVLVAAMILAVHLPPGYGQASSSQYYGYEAQYKVKVEFVRVRMRDGVEVAARITRPDAEGRFPAIMSYSPYRLLMRLKSSVPSEREYDHYLHGSSYFAERGYAVIDYDVRGTGNSAGSSQDIYADDERRDAYEMVEWIAAQPWCTGNVGLWGMSYRGVVQWQVAKQQPPHLKAMLVGSANTDVYLDWTYPGGALRPYMFDSYSSIMTAYNFSPPDIEVAGQKWSEIWREHLENNRPWGLGYITHPVHGPYWRDRSLEPDYDRVTVPTMVYSGWVDPYPTPGLRAFSKVEVPKRALIGPWGHSWPENALPGPRIDGRVEFLKWFDQWLKGIDTGVLEEPPITLFVRTYSEPHPRMADEDAGFFRYEKEWPLARTQYKAMHFHSGGRLSQELSASAQEERDTYTYHPAVGITSGIYWGGGILPWAMPIDQRHDEAYSLTYTTPVLKEDTEVTGEPKAVLYVSSSADTAYFHVKITDVAPDGTSKWVADGGLLGSHRNSHAEPEPLEPGAVYELKIPLKYMAYLFPAGHRIRIDVASADFQNAWPTAKPAVNAIHRSKKYPSHIVLPFVPPQNPKLPPPDLKPSPTPVPKPEEKMKTKHRIIQDLVNQTTTVELMRSGSSKSENGQTEWTRNLQSAYTVSHTDPANAVLKATCEYTIIRVGEIIKVEANEVTSSDITSFRHLTEVEVTLNGRRHFHKSWEVSVPRKYN